MNHLGTKTLETERLILRRFTIEDAEDMYQNWANDPEVTKYLPWQAHKNVDVSKSVLADWIKQYSDPEYYQWAITLKSSNQPVIGSIGAVGKNDDLQIVQIGYCIGRKWWHQGITSEALRAIINLFISEVGVNRVEAKHDPNNSNSGKVMLKCGMKYEGTMRQVHRNNQGIGDSAWYAILACDYSK